MVQRYDETGKRTTKTVVKMYQIIIWNQIALLLNAFVGHTLVFRRGKSCELFEICGKVGT